MSALILIFAPVVLAVALVVLFGVKVVPQGKCYMLERFGRHTRTLHPGLHFVIPFADMVARKVDQRECAISVPALDVVSSDNITLRTDASIFFRVVDARKAVYEVDDYAEALTNVALSNLRAEIGSMPLDGLMSKRDELGRRLKSVLDFAASPWGMSVTRVDIKNLTPPAEITQATAKQVKAEREKRAEIMEAEAAKKAAILRADGEREAAGRLAEARRKSAALEAEAREREAAAEVQAARTLSNAVRSGEVEVAALNYFLSQQYIAALQKIAEGDPSRVVISPTDPVSFSTRALQSPEGARIDQSTDADDIPLSLAGIEEAVTAASKEGEKRSKKRGENLKA